MIQSASTSKKTEVSGWAHAGDLIKRKLLLRDKHGCQGSGRTSTSVEPGRKAYWVLAMKVKTLKRIDVCVFTVFSL
jgi:hypothetical protein